MQNARMDTVDLVEDTEAAELDVMVRGREEARVTPEHEGYSLFSAD